MQINPEMMAQFQKIAAGMTDPIMKQAKDLKPKLLWDIQKFNSIEEIKNFINRETKITNIQIDFINFFILFSREV